MSRLLVEGEEEVPNVNRGELLRSGLAWMVLPALGIEAALSPALFREWLLQRTAFYLPTLAGIAIPIYLAQLALWPLAFLASLAGWRRGAAGTAVTAGVLGVASLWASRGHVAVGLPALSLLLAWASWTSRRFPSPWLTWAPARAGAVLLCVGLAAAFFAVIPGVLTHHAAVLNCGGCIMAPRTFTIRLGSRHLVYGRETLSPFAQGGANWVLIGVYALWAAAAVAGVALWRRRPEIPLALALFAPASAVIAMDAAPDVLRPGISWYEWGLGGAALLLGLLSLELVLGWSSAGRRSPGG